MWAECGDILPLDLRAWRAIEALHRVVTRRLVDTAEEHDVLEALLDGSKPPIPEEAEDLHGLLFAPFRYPPLPWGSRFGVRWQRGIWYGALEVRTALAEVAFYRLVFLDQSDAELGPLDLRFTAFRARVHTAAGARLESFAQHQDALCAPDDYGPTQRLGEAMRDAGVEAFTYASARDAQRGLNVGVLAPDALRDAELGESTRWLCHLNAQVVEFRPHDLLAPAGDVLRFPRSAFEVDGRLPVPAG